uniref:hypothetical protein n=1 Tax=uncultured Caulobacter sp. TaxID=158749 RepID=UPI002639CBB5
ARKREQRERTAERERVARVHAVQQGRHEAASGERTDTIAFASSTTAIARPCPTALPTGVGGWLRVFATPLLDDLPAEARATVREAATALLAELPRNAAGQPLADHVRLRVLARRR